MYLGLDFGTSGARACVIDDVGKVAHANRVIYPKPADQTPDDWRGALYSLLAQIPAPIAHQLKRIAIDGTSASVLLCDGNLNPVTPALLYNDNRASEQARYLHNLAPEEHIALSASSGLSKFLWLIQNDNHEDVAHFMHQTDWLGALLSGSGGISDYHNALKSGYDVENLCWPDWVLQLPYSHLLPSVLEPGEFIAEISVTIANRFKINPACTIQAGTTDSIAAFMAAEVNQPGEAVTSLGTTMVLKLLSETKVNAAKYGIYSHRYGELWLAGGASNSGAGVLKQYFTDHQLTELSKNIDGATDSLLDFYPLQKKGERFPYNDPELMPRLSPRPVDDTKFLHGMLQGLSEIEARGYALLGQLNASALRAVHTSGGGAQNTCWTQIRQRALGVPVLVASHTEAAYGSALLARDAGINKKFNS